MIKKRWNHRQSDSFTKVKLTLARTSHCLSRHFCLILFGPPNFFMSLQKSHSPQSSVRMQASHSPHMRAERLIYGQIPNTPHSQSKGLTNNTLQLSSSQRLFADSSFYESEFLTRDPRRPSDLKSGVSGWLSVPSASDSFSRLFLGRYLISRNYFYLHQRMHTLRVAIDTIII